MKTALFDYHLPSGLIAQEPLSKRDESRLMVLHRDSNQIDHGIFKDVIDYLKDKDCLVINETKVLPARLYGLKHRTGGQVELLLLKERKNGYWEALSRPAKKLEKGAKVVFAGSKLQASIVGELGEGKKIISFNLGKDVFWKEIQRIGEIPLPPYIKQKLANPTRYQTIFARDERSAAAPTAGLHFTEELLNKIKQRNISICSSTLDIGLDTFLPVREADIEDHKIHSEFFRLEKESADIINQRKQQKGRIVAIGTTTTRLLETIASEKGLVTPVAGETDLFIYPGYQFKVVDVLLTNFHLPRSSLIMMVAAFAGYDLIMKAYQTAIDEKYRFYSFGDAMLII